MQPMKTATQLRWQYCFSSLSRTSWARLRNNFMLPSEKKKIPDYTVFSKFFCYFCQFQTIFSCGEMLKHIQYFIMQEKDFQRKNSTIPSKPVGAFVEYK